MEFVTPSEDRIGAYLPVSRLLNVHQLWLPRAHVYSSSGLWRYDKNIPPRPSICLLFQKGTCSYGERCNQLHVDAKALNFIVNSVNAMDVAVTNAMCLNISAFCCVYHAPQLNDTLFTEFASSHDIVVPIGDGNFYIIPGTRMCYTDYWRKRVRVMEEFSERLYTIPRTHFCKLHATDNCTHGQNCHRVHLCREHYPLLVDLFLTETPAAHAQLLPRVLAAEPPLPQMPLDELLRLIDEKKEKDM